MTIQDFRYYFAKRGSYSQHGEDMLLKSYFEKKRNGFFVDVGAHHPFRFSNTFFFYKLGWRGINIDAQPGTKKIFDMFRSRDTNLELGIADKEGILTYYMFDEPALNGFSKPLSESRDTDTSYKILSTKDIPVYPLGKVLQDHVPAGTHIDFMSVDVEGLDLEVLQSNNWDKFRPHLVVAEDLDLVLENLPDSVIYGYLSSVGYKLVGKTLTSLVFMDKRNQ